MLIVWLIEYNDILKINIFIIYDKKNVENILDLKFVKMYYFVEKYLVYEFVKYWYGVFEEYFNFGEN